MSNKILGRGLSSLLREEVAPVRSQVNADTKVSIKRLKANENQPRKSFDDEKLQELSQSILRHGVLQPILVKAIENDCYEIIAGERRYRASILAGLESVPVIIKDLSPREILEIAIIENIQREDLNIIEEAQSYQNLIDNFDYSQSELASFLGKSRSHIANLLRLCNLPIEIKALVAQNKLAMGHARCLIGMDEMAALSIAQKVINEEWSVRKLEKAISDNKNESKKRSVKQQDSSNVSHETENEDVKILVQSLSDKFGVKVSVENSGNFGSISFHYNSLEELDAILSKIN